MTIKAIPSRPELVKQSLDARRHVEKNLFDNLFVPKMVSIFVRKIIKKE